jgi:outer membrane protein W
MKKLSKLIGIVLLAQAPAALAAPGWYAQITGGLANQGDQDLSYRPGDVRREASLSSGILGGAAIGYALGNGWRLEGEFMYQSVDMDALSFGAGLPSGDGNFASTSFAANALYEFDWFGSPKARTYVGIGFARLTEVDIDFETGGTETSFSGSENAVQFLFGARYDLGESSYIDAGLRYLTASDIELEGEDRTAGTIRADYQPWAVTLSWGWRF